MEPEPRGSGFSFLDNRQNLKPIKSDLTILLQKQQKNSYGTTR